LALALIAFCLIEEKEKKRKEKKRKLVYVRIGSFPTHISCVIVRRKYAAFKNVGTCTMALVPATLSWY